IDDFGTGYSSLDKLRKFPIDTLKIDRSFITEVPDNDEAAVLAKAIITMGQGLKLKLVAEGVETERQRLYLGSLGCHEFQGYLYSPPVKESVFRGLLNSPFD
ncbi:MAG: EAL domain-containing protein, partial [Pseudomonadota bacterium]